MRLSHGSGTERAKENQNAFSNLGSSPLVLCRLLARKLVRASFPQIGQKFGGRDHSTVMHAQSVVERRLAEDPAFRSAIEALERALTVQRTA